MACHGRLHDTAVPAPWKLSYAPCQQGFFFPFLSLPSPLHSPSFFLFPCPLLHSPFCWEVRIQGGGGSPAGAAATAAVEPQLLRLSKWSWWVKKSHQNGGFCSSSSPQGLEEKATLLAHSGASTYSAFPALQETHQAIPSALHPAAPRCGSGTSRPWFCYTLSQEDYTPCHRYLFPTGQGPVHWCTPHAQAHPWTGAASCWKSNPCCPPSPVPSLCKERESKELIKAWEINHISV